MTVEEFERNLSKKCDNIGGVFKKADFHIHMPGSSDYEYKGEDAMELLAKAIRDKEYAFAIVLEHEQFPTVQKIVELQKLCPKTLIIPGAEINVFVEALGKKVGKDYYFHCIVAVHPTQQIQDYNYLIQKAKEEFIFKGSEYPSGFASSIQDLGQFFIENNAIFIPAHLHQSKPAENSRSIDDIYDDDAFLGFVESGCFTALEVREAKTATFFTGDKKTNTSRSIPKSICVQSTDAHSHQHLIDRDRFTWIQCQDNTFEELQAALSFNHRVLLTLPTSNYSYIKGLHISGNFIKDEWVGLNQSLNCLIGSKGSGKTSILECLRFVLGTTIPKERKESVNKHIAHILGSSGFVECLIKRDDGTTALLTRRSDSPHRLRVVEADNSTKEIEASDSFGFEAAILGWHEIEAIADDPVARISLIDRLGIEGQIKSHIEQIDLRVTRAREEFPAFQTKLKNLEDKLKQRKALKDKRNTLDKLEKVNLLKLQTEYEQYITCEQKLESLKTRVAKVNRQFQSQLESNFSGFIDDFKEIEAYPVPIKEIIKLSKETYISISSTKSETSTLLNDKILAVERSTSEHIQSIKQQFSKFRQETYDPEVNALPSDEREILTKQIQIIEETKQLPEVELECKGLEAEIKKIAESLHQICNEICEHRSKISKLRSDLIDVLNKEIRTIKINFLRSANKGRVTQFQNAHQLSVDIIGFVSSYGQIDNYENLRELFSKYTKLSIDASDLEFRTLIYDTVFVDFLKVIDDDDVELSLVLKNGSISPIQNLSAGQRCTTVFPLLLRIKTGPLILDQPEDNLDNRHIADIIAPEFLEKKKHQQFILTSHNANLVVLTDSDAIFHVDSDGSTGKIIKRGFFSCASSAIKGDVLSALDGGETALLARQKKYGLKS